MTPQAGNPAAAAAAAEAVGQPVTVRNTSSESYFQRQPPPRSTSFNVCYIWGLGYCCQQTCVKSKTSCANFKPSLAGSPSNSQLTPKHARRDGQTVHEQRSQFIYSPHYGWMPLLFLFLSCYHCSLVVAPEGVQLAAAPPKPFPVSPTSSAAALTHHVCGGLSGAGGHDPQMPVRARFAFNLPTRPFRFLWFLFVFQSPAEDVFFASPSVNPALSAKFTSSTGLQEGGHGEKTGLALHIRVTPGCLSSSQQQQSKRGIAKYGKRGVEV